MRASSSLEGVEDDSVTSPEMPHAPGSGALSELMPVAYEELRGLARSYLQGERAGHTLQPTALVHEAYLRLLDQQKLVWENRAQFLAIAARMMRRILTNYAVARTRVKRGGCDLVKLTLDEALDFYEARDINLQTMEEALTELEALDKRQAEIVELRFYGGLTVEEISTFLGISSRTVKREWSTAKRWLRFALSAN
jgi:RNA polymerase sigma factor (TIGR02999 family)